MEAVASDTFGLDTVCDATVTEQWSTQRIKRVQLIGSCYIRFRQQMSAGINGNLY
jgi:hypothetical protein